VIFFPVKTFLVVPLDGEHFRVECDRFDVEPKTGVVVFRKDDEAFPTGALALESVAGVFDESAIRD